MISLIGFISQNITEEFAIVFYTLVTLVIILSYMFLSIGLYNIAKKEDYNYKWLSWMPILKLCAQSKVAFNRYTIGVVLLIIEFIIFTVMYPGALLLVKYTQIIFIIFALNLIYFASYNYMVYKIYRKYSNKYILLTIFSILTLDVIVPYAMFSISYNEHINKPINKKKRKKIAAISTLVILLIFALFDFLNFPVVNNDISKVNIQGKTRLLKKKDYVDIDDEEVQINSDFLNDTNAYIYKNITIGSTLDDLISAYKLNSSNALIADIDYDETLEEDSERYADFFSKKRCEENDNSCEILFGYKRTLFSWKLINCFKLEKIMRATDYMVGDLGDYPSNTVVYDITVCEGEVCHITLMRN